MKATFAHVISPVIGPVVAVIMLSAGCGTLDNPPVTMEPAWDSPKTRELAVTACFDCHSNHSRWPWYAKLPVVQALMANNVHEGRSKLNFSAWDQPQKDADEVDDVILEGEMPPADFLLMHKEADLSPADRQSLVDGLCATFARSPPLGGKAGDKAGDTTDNGHDGHAD